MGVPQDAIDHDHAREYGLVAVGFIGFLIAAVFMGWCLFGHQRPNMPRAEVIVDVGSAG